MPSGVPVNVCLACKQTLPSRSRDRRGMTGGELADKAGITQPYLSEIETGKKDGGLKVMAKIAAILGVSLDNLVM